jgi:hypothetical protein
MSYNTLPRLTALGLATALLACGGNDSGASYSTGLPASEKLSELTSSDAGTVCDTLRHAVDTVLPATEIKRLQCVGLAVQGSITVHSAGTAQMSVTVDVNMCEDLAQKCESGQSVGDSSSQQDIELPDFKVDCDAGKVSSALANCDATISEFESCLNHRVDLLQQLLNALQCETFENPEQAQNKLAALEHPQEDAACKAVETKCANVFDHFFDEGDTSAMVNSMTSNSSSSSSSSTPKQ